MSELIIRMERPEDYYQTEHVNLRAFWNLHGVGAQEHFLVHNLRNADCLKPELCRVAELDGRIVGCIFYASAILNAGGVDHEVLTFGPLSVDPEAQSTGVGAALLNATIPLAKEAGYPGIIIFGEPEYYPRFGFKTCDNFGITDWEGGNFSAFMGLELRPGALSEIGGRFRESEVYEMMDGLEEYTKNFPSYPRIALPLQWGYDGEDWELYRLIEARYNRRDYQAMFDRYVLDIGQYDSALLENAADGHYLPEEVRNCLASPSKRPYIITRDGEQIGLAVLSGPDPEDEPDGCTHYIEELFVLPEYRNKGIATDLALRYLRQNENSCGLCVNKSNAKAVRFWESIAEKGGYTLSKSDSGKYWWFVFSKAE